jgi:glycosyltransferase involved in cell wall biosynthesis
VANQRLRVCVLGSGTRFLSGVSYYTQQLAVALSSSHEVSVILMRQLLPTRLYPGRRRVGMPLTQLTYPPAVHIFDGVDWYWLPSIVRAVFFLLRERPQVAILQWWTGTVLHTYLALSIVAQLCGARVIVEFHETLDTGEARIWLARRYVRVMASALLRMADGYVMHSHYDRVALEHHYALGVRPIVVIPHGPYSQYRRKSSAHEVQRQNPPDPPSCCHLLYFGVIRPYKGVEDLITAFDALPPSAVTNYHLTVVGETWEGWTAPADLIARSRYRDRITFVNRYVTDEEVAEFFATADAVALPYHRSSASGPLHVAMSHGLPVIVSAVGGLTEAVAGYEGAIVTPPGDISAIRAAFEQVAPLRGKRFADPHSWQRTADRYAELFTMLLGPAANGTSAVAPAPRRGSFVSPPPMPPAGPEDQPLAGRSRIVPEQKAQG